MDSDIIKDCCWALSFLSDEKLQIGKICDTGIVPRMVALLGSDNYLILAPALLTIRNIAGAGNYNQVKTII